LNEEDFEAKLKALKEKLALLKRREKFAGELMQKLEEMESRQDMFSSQFSKILEKLEKGERELLELRNEINKLRKICREIILIFESYVSLV
jgi:phage shock protein A